MPQLSHDAQVAFIRDPERWPYWPVLPVKRPGHHDGPTVGWITADYPHVLLRERPTTRGIILQLRFELTDAEMDELGFFDPRHLFPEDARPLYEGAIVQRFQDVHALLDAGWVID